MKFRIMTVTEYDKYKIFLPNPERRFWLDPCGIPSDGRFPVVDENGMKNRFGEHPYMESVFLRPVIEYDREETRPLFKQGDKLELYGYSWTAVSDTALVCDRCLSEYKFNDTPCLFKDSYLRYILNQIFIEKQAEARRNETKKGRLSKNELIKELYDRSLSADKSAGGQLAAGVVLSAIGVMIAGIALGSFIEAPSLSIIWKLIVAAGALGVGGILSAIGIKNKHQGGRDYLADNIQPLLTEIKMVATDTESGVALADYNEDGELETSAIKDADIRSRFVEINKLVQRINTSGNRAVIAKLNGFYIPETKKLYDVCLQFEEDDIDSPQTRECMNMVRESLDKTIQLLTVEYDKSNVDKLQDISFDLGVKQKMIDMNESEQDLELKV